MLYFFVFLMFVVAFVAICSAIAFAIVAFAKKRKRKDYKSHLKHCYAALGTFGSAVVLLVILAVLIAGTNPQATIGSVAASTAPGPRTRITIAAGTAAPTATPTAQPAPTHTDNADLENFRENWNDIMNRAAYSVVAVEKARDFVAQGNLIDASDRLAKCQDAASGVNDDAANLNLYTGDESDAALRESIRQIGDGYGYGCKALRKFLDTNAPSDASDARSEFSGASDAIDDAILRATEKYKLMGGDVNELLDPKTARQQVRM